MILHAQQRLAATSALPSALVGRDVLLDQIADQIVAQPLVTLIGSGGVGKTSVAHQLALHAAVVTTVADGVRWVDLAALADPAGLPQAVAAACGLAEQRGHSWLEIVVTALHPAHMLLVLDNCEHLRSACADLCAQLLAACPQLHIVATTREPLGLAGELRVLIPPLDSAAALALFALRATAHLRTFTLDDQSLPAVASICAQLDGLPLAIELAAARVTLLSVAQIAARMQQSLSLLVDRQLERPSRQRSLRAALDWSYALLGVGEQRLLAQLSVFAGSFDFDAVEAVCRVAAPLDALAALADASLVVIQHDPVRYRLHEVVRQYAAERLAQTGDAHATRVHHLAWAVALAEHAELAFNTTPTSVWLAGLALEHENIRSALSAAHDGGDADSVLRLAGALMQFWNSVSISEGRAWLARGRAGTFTQPSIVSVGAWNCESFLAYRQGDYNSMHTAATAALHEAMLIEYTEGIAAARYRLGIYTEMKGATGEARDHYHQSLALFREVGDRRGMSQVLNGLAHVASIDGDLPEARQYYTEGLALARAESNHLSIALLLISLANLLLDTSDLDAAAAAYAESLLLLRAADHGSYVLYAVNGLGEVAHYRGDFVAATAHYREALQMARAGGLKDMEAQLLAHLGRTATAHGDYAAAARCLSESLRLYVPLARTARTVAVIHCCADLILRRGYPAQATTLFTAGLHALDADDFSYLGNDSAEMLARSNLARAALAADQAALAVADGMALTLAQAAELALSAVFLPERPLPGVPELQVFLFGQLRVVRAGHELSGDDWVYSKTKDMLLFLLLVDSADQAADKTEIGAALWPDASPEQLKQNFRVAIYHLRRALGRAEWITFRNGRYAFNRALAAWIDITAFERAVQQAATDAAQRMKHLRSAAALYVGDLTLGDLEGDLAQLRRERFQQQALAVLLALGDLQLDGGQWVAAAAFYRRVLALDCYSEAAQRGLLRSLVRQGEVGAALAEYSRFAALLAMELGMTPTQETAALAAQIQAGTAI